MKELRWVQPDWKHRKYELRDGETTLARLEFRGKWKESAFIFLDAEQLAVESSGFWKTRYVIRLGEREVAVHNGPAAPKQLAFVNGRRFTWKRKSTWSSAYNFVADDNHVLMTFRSKSRWFRSECLIEVAAGADKYAETRLLLAFGWFLILKQEQGAVITVAAG